MSRIEWTPQKVERQVRFGIARGLTNTAKKAAAAVLADLPTTFDRPTPFTMRAIGTTMAKRDDLVATVFVRPTQLEYLGLQITGGQRVPLPGKPVNVPGEKAKKNAYGNLPRRVIKRYLARKDTFVADGKGKTSHLKPGVYRRAKTGERRDGERGVKGALRHGGEGRATGGVRAKGATSLELLVGFKPAASYARRFDFVEMVEQSAGKNIAAEINASVAQALATAR